jgi:LPS export ABC transporter protein LptC
LAILVATCLLAGALAACEEESNQPRTTALPSGPAGYPAPDQVVENGQHVITVQGVRKAVMVAEQLYFYEQLGKVVGDTIEVTFYDEEGTYESTLTARTGELQEATQAMIAKGNVMVRSEDSSIRTEELQYDPAQDQVSTNQQTEIVQRGNVIRGRGVTADPGLKNIQIRGGSAVLRTEPDVRPPPPQDTLVPPPQVPDRVPPTTDGAP